ncbi:hypothetical protein L198_01053 [Cryptococcus wingfieldii CBS 7118]|uniref:Cytoplasmic protein n=1 Tax=Cryptococcus wingfieldii CBS 7118 TaxID=1295528 RepID=A0A1E3K2S2_9TREE|nr:hypothetical protein L198_01053 [Cryptococcus wingfieldii CBS 7118]ODO07474.1 hypothetical protein L198_01053 [Cryptococcus wingfieldii CBS 7118]
MSNSNENNKVVLITGTSQGVGLGLAKSYLERGWTVITAIRSPEKAPKLGGKSILVKIDHSSLTDFKDAVEELKTKHNITHLDTVISNAGANDSGSLLLEADADEFDWDYKVNTRGPLLLYQATRPLLKDNGTFAVISSLAGSITRDFLWEKFGLYGASKAAVNYLVRTIHHEEPALKAFTIHPGIVDTKMGREGGSNRGWDAAPSETVEGVVPGITKTIDDATKEETSGWMWMK